MPRSSASRLPPQAGLTLIEAVIVLGIFGLVIAAVFAAYSSVNTQNKTKAASEQLAIIVNQVRSAYAGHSAIDAGATAATLTTGMVNAGLLPAGWCSFNAGVASCTSPWGGALTIAPATHVTANDSIQITFNGLTQYADCASLINKTAGASSPLGLYNIASNGGAGTAVQVGTPITQDFINGICKVGGGTNSLSFSYSLNGS